MTKTKHLLIIFALTLAAFGGTLTNGFVGDDEVVVARNTFYSSLSNLPRLFSKSYNTRGVNFTLGIEQDNASGSVAYRPVLSLTYFIDRAVWRLNPFGFHLTNLLLHISNTALVYFLITQLFQKSSMALFTALLFATHPIQVEAVANIGFRADLLSTLFILSSVNSFIFSFNGKQIVRRGMFVFSMVCYLLAVFTKESAIVVPLLLAGYTWIFYGRTFKNILRDCFRLYAGYVVIAVFYLFIYFLVFPNTSLGVGILDAMPLPRRLLTGCYILWLYFKDFCFPFQVRLLPGLYAPSLDAAGIFKAVLALGGIGAMVVAVFRSSASILRYALLWFVVSLIPVSNIIPLANPIAHRFMYLPSIGFLTFISALLDRCLGEKSVLPRVKSLNTIVRCAIIGFFMIYTMPLTKMWKSNYMVARELIQERSEHYLGFYLLGLEYSNALRLDEARKYFLQAEERGMDDPRIYHMLGICFTGADRETAKRYFMKNIQEFSDYPMSYGGYGRVLMFEGQYAKALPYFEKHLQLIPSYAVYAYMIEAYYLLNQPEKAKEVYERSLRQDLPDDQRRSLERMLLTGSNLTRAVDVGL